MRKILAMLFFPLVLNAEPGPTTQYLMNEPATLFDIAMVRLDDLTDEFENRVGLHWTDGDEMKWFRAEINPYYEPDADKIYVGMTLMKSGANRVQMAEGCQYAMMQMNIWLLKSLPRIFLHVDHRGTPSPKDLFSGLTDMIEIRCSFSSGNDESNEPFMAHRKLGSLGDNQMVIGKW